MVQDTGEKLLAAQPYTAPILAAPRLHVRHLKRYELGTRYPAIVEDVRSLLSGAAFRHRIERTALIIDRTGVGRAVMDIFHTAEVYPIGITIHGGERVIMENSMHYRVPKRDLVAAAIKYLQNGFLKIAATLPHADTLKRELQNFRLKIDPKTAHDSYTHWRDGDHDDLVLAVALACWWRDYLVAWQYRDLAG